MSKFRKQKKRSKKLQQYLRKNQIHKGILYLSSDKLSRKLVQHSAALRELNQTLIHNRSGDAILQKNKAILSKMAAELSTTPLPPKTVLQHVWKWSKILLLVGGVLIGLLVVVSNQFQMLEKQAEEDMKRGDYQIAAEKYDQLFKAFNRLNEGNIGAGNSLSNKALALYMMDQTNTSNALSVFDEFLLSEKIDIQISGLYLRGRFAFQHLDSINMAENDFLSALKLDSTKIGSYQNLWDLYLKTSDFENANDYLSKALKIDPNSSEVHQSIGKYHLLKGDTTNALAAYTKASKINNDFRDSTLASIYYQKAKQSQAEGKTELALADLNTAIKHNDEHPLYYSERAKWNQENGSSLDQVQKDLERSLKYNANQPEVLAFLGDVIAQTEYPFGAIETYTEAIQQDSTNAELYVARAKLRVRKEELNLAIQDFEAALSLDTSQKYLYAEIGELYAKLNRYEEAFAAYDRAIEQDDQNGRSFFLRGKAYFSQDSLRSVDMEAALEDFSTSITLNPNEAEYYLYRGLLQEQMQNSVAAKKDSQEAVNLQPNQPPTPYWKANTLVALNRYSAALPFLNLLIDSDTTADMTLRELLLLRGRCHLAEATRLQKSRKVNRLEDAWADFESSQKLDRTDYRSWGNLGLVAFHQADHPTEYEISAKYFQQAIRLHRMEGWLVKGYADALWAQGKFLDAFSQYSYAAIYIKDDPDVFHRMALILLEGYDHPIHLELEITSHLRRAISLAPDDQNLYYDLISVYQERSTCELDSALDVCKQLLGRYPKDSLVFQHKTELDSSQECASQLVSSLRKEYRHISSLKKTLRSWLLYLMGLLIFFAFFFLALQLYRRHWTLF